MSKKKYDHAIKVQTMSDEHLLNSATWHWRNGLEKWYDEAADANSLYKGSLQDFITKNQPGYFAAIKEIEIRNLSYDAPHQRKIQPAFDKKNPFNK